MFEAITPRLLNLGAESPSAYMVPTRVGGVIELEHEDAQDRRSIPSIEKRMRH